MRRAFDGVSVFFGRLTGFALTVPFTGAVFFFGGTGFTGFFAALFLSGNGFDTFDGAAFGGDTLGGVFFCTDAAGFAAGLLAAGFTGGGFCTAFATGFVAAAGLAAAGFVPAAGAALVGSFVDSFGAAFAGSFGACGLLAGGFGLVSLTAAGVAAGGVGTDAGFAGAGGVRMGDTQLRLTASASIALNCDSNSGESGTS